MTPGAKKYCFTGKCPLDMALRRQLMTFARAGSWACWDFNKRELNRGRVQIE